MNTMVRRAVENDIEQILDILNYEIINTTSVYDITPKTINQQIEWFKRKNKLNYPVFVIEKNGKIHGWASYDSFRTKEGNKYTIEHSIYISKESRSFGYGKLLMSALISQANEDGYKTMIGGVDANNQSSIKFHKDFGFEEIGLAKNIGFKFDRWLDLLFMQLMLD
jgi:L-amino acid N-acyltransferase